MLLMQFAAAYKFICNAYSIGRYNFNIIICLWISILNRYNIYDVITECTLFSCQFFLDSKKKNITNNRENNTKYFLFLINSIRF